MTTQLFGTDGIRGRANFTPMTAETMLHVAMAAAAELTRGDHRHKVLIGKDTRLSGYMIEQALSAGFVSMGMDVVFVGPLPTPAVAMLTRSLRCDMGVMISASHNPYQDNGIKLFGPDGYKLSDELEAAIEKRVAENNFADMLVSPETIGRATRLDDASGRYVEYVKATFPRGQRLDGMKIAIDCANGAAYKVAPQVLWELGADVVPVAVNPDGRNINAECGATAPDLLQQTVVSHGADIGIALDGDADRVIIVDEKGRVIDGDQIMGLIAASWASDGLLNGGGIVATVMSNLGLERYLETLSMELARVPVGDRHVVEHMRNSGFNLGGEQSGHIILSDYSTTGDGLIAALQVLSVLKGQGKPASAVCDVFAPLPQLLRNVRFERGQTPLELNAVQESIRDAERKLAASGRLLVRKSGTEPVVRVMAEGDDAALVDTVVGEVCAAIEAATSGNAAA